jgi:photosystem II stability/assembly factor-like uncharacterized protein
VKDRMTKTDPPRRAVLFAAIVVLCAALPTAALEPLATFDEPVDAMIVSPLDPRVMFVVAGETFHASTDGGATWRATEVPRLLNGDRILLPDLGNRLGAFLLSGGQTTQFAPGRVYRTLDAGTNWFPLAQMIPDLQIASFTQSAADPATLYCADASGVIHQTTDYGKTWVGLEVSRFRGMKVGTIATFAKAPRTLLVAAVPWESHCPCGDVVRSTDGGANWEKVVPVVDPQTGRETIPGVVELRTLPADPATVWGVEAYLALVSRDGGATWKEITNALDERVAALGHVVLDPDDARTVYLYSTAVRRSQGGEKWEVVSDPRMPIAALAIRPVDKKTREIVFASGKMLYAVPLDAAKRSKRDAADRKGNENESF